MIVEFDKSFEKSFDSIRYKSVFSRIERTIVLCEMAGSLSEIPNLKKLAGYKSY